MPVSVVVGGQFGSEGKGKTALELAVRLNATHVVRVGGTNSGHTAIDKNGKVWAFRQLPVSILAPSATAVLPAGAIIDPEIFQAEVDSLNLDPSRIVISPFATVISSEDREAERSSGIVSAIGSTGSGTGAALLRRIGRKGDAPILASEHSVLKRYVRDAGDVMRAALNRNSWIVIEGSQGFGLSVLHGGYYPKATSRDTTAAAFVGEAGLSPLDVREVTLVLRMHPIRVAGNSGPLSGETTWAEIARQAGLPASYCELTTATKKVRRVGIFDPDIVRRAIGANNPSRIVLNHFDYTNKDVRDGIFSVNALELIRKTERSIGRTIDWIGTGPDIFIERQNIGDTGQSKYFKKSLSS